jgi:hypothetical protein
MTVAAFRQALKASTAVKVNEGSLLESLPRIFQAAFISGANGEARSVSTSAFATLW